jgi:hypothetical protein
VASKVRDMAALPRFDDAWTLLPCAPTSCQAVCKADTTRFGFRAFGANAM